MKKILFAFLKFLGQYEMIHKQAQLDGGGWVARVEEDWQDWVGLKRGEGPQAHLLCTCLQVHLLSLWMLSAQGVRSSGTSCIEMG